MSRKRTILIFVLFIISTAAIIGRLVCFQILHHDFYKALAQGQKNDLRLAKGPRGRIYFKGGEILATDSKKIYLFACPRDIKEKEKTAEKLSEILGLKKEEILEKIKKDSLFEKIKSDLTKEEQEKIKQEELKGIYLGEEESRFYPQGEMASHIVGFVGGNGKGQYGLEEYYDDILQGEEGVFSLGTFELEKKRGASLFLTVDYNIQFTAEKLLEEAKEKFEIESGQIIVMDPMTGKILALAVFPRFNPNNYYKIKDLSIFQNPVIQKLYEPGSVFKAITMAGALNEGVVGPETEFVDDGSVRIKGRVIYNYGHHIFGKQTMVNVLEKSINTGAVFAEQKLGHNKFLEYIEKFGFFEPTGIDLAGEIFSENKELKKGYEVNFATASFGQGIEITPIQLLRAFSAIANGGHLVKPFLVEKIVKNNGETIINTPELSSNNVISEKTSAQLTAMLVSVVKNGPYTKRARISGYYVAGKTGTSQIPWSSLGIKKRGYSDKTWQSFIGFVPAFNPKFLILVKLDNPNTKVSEYSAVPLFREIAEYIIKYLQIPPDYQEEK